jgi:hypothetical protein
MHLMARSRVHGRDHARDTATCWERGTKMADEEQQLRLRAITGTGNDLFGLDDAGVVWRYNFQRESWVRLKMTTEQAFESRGAGRLT